MKKTDKKIDNAIRGALTEVCDKALEEHDGFMWLTHLVDYQSFPASLSITCVFDTNEQLSNAHVEDLRVIIKDKLASIAIYINHSQQTVRFDTEENCTKEHKGNWQQRLN
tara:strand:+ start:1822 stop:2151 length:330 start_codon:yes stop_codon:yes gene_type:complete